MEITLGVCLGASTLKVVLLEGSGAAPEIQKVIIEPHRGRPLEKYRDILSKIGIERVRYAAVTGRKFKDYLEAATITEPEATESAVELLMARENRDFQGIVSAGSENFVLYRLNEMGHIIDVRTGNKCASGTGAFFLQQIGRMNLTIEEAIASPNSHKPYIVSGRCSVFCKSDCTHALNKGIPHGRVIAGLCRMMADKICELIGGMEARNFVVVGGVTRNRIVMESLAEEIQDMVIPVEAEYFEALGAAFFALKNKVLPGNLLAIRKNESSYTMLPAIGEAENLVSFRSMDRGEPQPGDECILGLDVGSTTTKAVIMRTGDGKILASVYLRTDGNPVRAARKCYQALDEDTGVPLEIIGLGVTGSGRYIAALHALSSGVVNEIISHAAAAAYFDEEVDTIFEIGGQDAKYTYLVNGVPSDYAMNEACSAGTGSFLEEAASENSDIHFREIGNKALSAKQVPNFSDQCAAFIGSDIKNASQENMSDEEIMAGLVYSVCFNYLNRVKGNRPSGKKIFFQGGVCYNRAIPLAMANILGKPLIVPPEPGLMGAFGVALEIRDKIDLGLLKPETFDLAELAGREVSYGKSFRCSGGTEKCDRKCEISVIEMEGKKYPFGGICDKYYNYRRGGSGISAGINLVKDRQKRVFHGHPETGAGKSVTIGLSRAFLTNTLFPFFYYYFHSLGFDVVVSDIIHPDGLKRVSASFCFPGEIAHGYVMDLIKKGVDYIFLPHIVELYLENSISYRKEYQSTCLLLQSEPYFLRSAFREWKEKFLTPVFDFYRGWDTQKDIFSELVRTFGVERTESDRAYTIALEKQKDFFRWRKEEGRKALARLEEDTDRTGIVIFGRAYNAFAGEANMGIPEKFSSRGYEVIPFDLLPYEEERPEYISCWATGQEILKASEFVASHPRLFGVYITNFSCGPDSFLLTYFRDIMKTKPSLTLELDSHAADAGINTRVEAFLDIMARYRRFRERETANVFKPLSTVFKKGVVHFKVPDGRTFSISDRRVRLLLPSMGRVATELTAASFRGMGVNARALPVSSASTLAAGRSQASCKECLPLILCCGGLKEYIENRKDPEEITVFFVPTTSGNCRFTQYAVYLNRLIEKDRLENVVLLTLTSENSFGGFGIRATSNFLKAIIVSDVMEDIRNSLEVLASDPVEAGRVFQEGLNDVITSFEKGAYDLFSVLKRISRRLKGIPLRMLLSEAKKVSILGEIFVRRDDFSTGPLIQRLNKRDIIVRKAPVMEWWYYVDYLIQHNLLGEKLSLKGKLYFFAKFRIQVHLERRIKRILSRSGLVEYDLIDVDKVIRIGSRFVNIELAGEPILVIGSFFKGIIDNVQGVVALGPFGCLPSRVIESILSREALLENKVMVEQNEEYRRLSESSRLPFLALEVDGEPFSQIVEASIEVFCLQVEKLHRRAAPGRV